MIGRWSQSGARVAFAVVILLGVAWVQPPHALAQTDSTLGENPLLIADASSPRATLRSFLDLSAEAIDIWRREGATDRVYVMLTGIREVLDFAATESGVEPVEQVRRILLLREVLDRIELPPWSEIPGRAEAEAGLEVWTIPGTRLRIGRVAEGPQTGEYIFTAGSVAELPQTYRRVRQLPYRPGARPILEDWESGSQGIFARAQSQLEDRLSRLDTSSPRSTFTGFLRHANIAYRIATEAEAALTATPPTISLEEARTAEVAATAHLLRAASAFDMSRVPASERRDLRIEAALMLKEVLDRVALPLVTEIPNEPAVRRAVDASAPFVWRFPGLPIKIFRVLEGDRAGAFVFDPRTVETLPGTFDRLGDLPYNTERSVLRSDWEYGGDDAISPGFYDFYISTPGSLVPSASVIGPLVLQLPDWTKQLRGGQTIWQWIGLGLAIVVGVAAALALNGAITRIARGRAEVLRAGLLILIPLLAIGIFVAIEVFVDQTLNITRGPRSWFVAGNRVVVLALTAWLIWQLFMAVAALITNLRRRPGSGPGTGPGTGIDASLTQILCGFTAVVVAMVVVVAGLRDIGVDAVPLIAGLGVGGLAVALAIRPTLENLIGGLILHTDRPLQIGDFCTIGDMRGTIESIGVRSTRIRALDRTLISLPNSRLADMDIVNWAHCDRMLITATLGLRYETTPDQLRHLLANIRRMLHAHPKIDRETVRVRYAGPGASSRDVNLRIYALTRDWNEFHALREDVFLRIDDLVEASGVGYAFPSQTLYLTRDPAPDAERTAAAEAEVAAWREANQMPFPRLAERTMDDLEGTLDYPPRGSTAWSTDDGTVEPAPERLSADAEARKPE
ncbi:MAG: mechanosensitive ion channel family protein [Alphaproteobacteria bacterium]|nr:mechanosensitive ion channel family protein [Alphaproteobacteria bacterium]